MYRSIFIDLDDTIWAFSENAQDTFKEMYDKYDFDKYFDSFSQFYSIYAEYNNKLWIEYGDGKITKEQLNERRFYHPLKSVGVNDKELAVNYSSDFFKSIVLKKKVLPNAFEALDYMVGKYNLYILSNGFRELQEQKMRSAGVDKYFKKVILSEDIGVHKPYSQIFHYAISATQSELKSSIMIGDNWENDVRGAKDAGMHQGFYNFWKKEKLDFSPDFVLNDWSEIKKFL